MESEHAHLFIVVVVLVLILGISIAPASANSCSRRDAQSIQYHDGSWWILVSHGQDNAGVIHQFSEEWESVQTYQIGPTVNRTEPNETSQWGIYFTSMVPAEDDGWWVLRERGTIYGFDDEWEFTGESVELSGAGISAYDIARVDNSSWALSRNGVFWHGENWDSAEKTTVKSHTNFPTLGLAEHDGNLFAIDSSSGMLYGGTVHRFAVDSAPKTQFDRSIRLGWETEKPRDVAISDDGRWVILEQDGGIVEYTNYWQHTGNSREVTDAIGYCGLSMAPLLYLPVGFLFLLIMTLGIGVLVKLEGSNPTVLVTYLVTNFIGLMLALSLLEYSLPDPLSLVFLLPDPLISGGIFGYLLLLLGVIGSLKDGTAPRRIGLSSIVNGIRAPGTAKNVILLCFYQFPLLVTAIAFLL